MLFFLEESNDLGMMLLKLAPESFRPEFGGEFIIRGGEPRLGMAVCRKLSAYSLLIILL